jgi:mono/diheme cytochrome c family protein
LAILSLCAATAFVAAGCGAVAHFNASSADPGVGKTLFQQKCGACHTLANAKTTGTIGPNLDDAFGPDKAQGFKLSTIVDVVRGQIAYPDTNPGTGSPGMTANLLHGQQARDVAAYVGECSAEPNCNVAAKPVGNTPG